MGTRCLSTTQVTIFVVWDYRDALYHIKNMGLCLHINKAFWYHQTEINYPSTIFKEFKSALPSTVLGLTSVKRLSLISMILVSSKICSAVIRGRGFHQLVPFRDPHPVSRANFFAVRCSFLFGWRHTVTLILDVTSCATWRRFSKICAKYTN